MSGNGDLSAVLDLNSLILISKASHGKMIKVNMIVQNNADMPSPVAKRIIDSIKMAAHKKKTEIHEALEPKSLASLLSLSLGANKNTRSQTQ